MEENAVQHQSSPVDDEMIIKQIKATLEKVRPFLQRDGGDINFIGYRDGIVYVKMAGACEGCGMAGADISQGVEIILMEEVPGVIGVKTDEIPPDIWKAYNDSLAQ